MDLNKERVSLVERKQTGGGDIQEVALPEQVFHSCSLIVNGHSSDSEYKARKR